MKKARNPWGSMSLSDRVISSLLWTANLTWAVPNFSLLGWLHGYLSLEQLEPWSRVYCRTQIALTGSRWRAHVHPSVDPQKNYLFLQNHTNHFDHVLLYPATPHVKQGLELAKHFHYPVYGWFMKRRGTIPVQPFARDNRKNMLDRARQEIAKGRSLLAFPEGTRTRTGQLGKFRKGVFQVALDLEIPIVPVTVVGAFDLMRKGSLLMKPGARIDVFCDEPIETERLSSEDIPALMNLVWNQMNKRLTASLSKSESLSEPENQLRR